MHLSLQALCKGLFHVGCTNTSAAAPVEWDRAGASWNEGPGLATALAAGVVGMAGLMGQAGLWGDAKQGEVVSLFVGTTEKFN